MDARKLRQRLQPAKPRSISQLGLTGKLKVSQPCRDAFKMELGSIEEVTMQQLCQAALKEEGAADEEIHLSWRQSPEPGENCCNAWRLHDSQPAGKRRWLPLFHRLRRSARQG